MRCSRGARLLRPDRWARRSRSEPPRCLRSPRRSQRSDGGPAAGSRQPRPPDRGRASRSLAGPHPEKDRFRPDRRSAPGRGRFLGRADSGAARRCREVAHAMGLSRRWPSGSQQQTAQGLSCRAGLVQASFHLSHSTKVRRKRRPTKGKETNTPWWVRIGWSETQSALWSRRCRLATPGGLRGALEVSTAATAWHQCLCPNSIGAPKPRW